MYFHRLFRPCLSDGNIELITDYLNLLVKWEHYTANDPLTFNCGGFRKDGEGIQEKGRLCHGGDLEQFSEFQLKAIT